MPHTPFTVLEELHRQCSAAVAETLVEENRSQLGEALKLITDLEACALAIEDRLESKLIQRSAQELLAASLSVCQGSYLTSFRSLRTSFELVMRAIYLSMNDLLLREWVVGARDVSWSQITDKETGVFGARTAAAYFPSFTDSVGRAQGICIELYRELSETVHGHGLSPKNGAYQIAFDRGRFDLWASKVDSFRFLALFAYCVRYSSLSNVSGQKTLSEIMLAELGHMSGVREIFGGAQ